MALFGGSKQVATPGTPVALGASTQKFTSLEIVARKANKTANTGSVYVGFTPTSLRPLAPGEKWPIALTENNFGTLGTIYVDSDNANDGVIFNGADR